MYVHAVHAHVCTCVCGWVPAVKARDRVGVRVTRDQKELASLVERLGTHTYVME